MHTPTLLFAQHFCSGIVFVLSASGSLFCAACEREAARRVVSSAMMVFRTPYYYYSSSGMACDHTHTHTHTFHAAERGKNEKERKSGIREHLGNFSHFARRQGKVMR